MAFREVLLYLTWRFYHHYEAFGLIHKCHLVGRGGSRIGQLLMTLGARKDSRGGEGEGEGWEERVGARSDGFKREMRWRNRAVLGDC